MKPGRPRCPRRIEAEPVVSYFKPRGVPLKELSVVTLSVEELEVVRLSDLEGLNQEEAAQRMGISRRTLWEDLQNARQKIAEALIEGKAIEITGGNYIMIKQEMYTCSECKTYWQAAIDTDDQKRCPQCGNEGIRQNYDEQRSADALRLCQGGCGRGKQHR